MADERPPILAQLVIEYLDTGTSINQNSSQITLTPKTSILMQHPTIADLPPYRREAFGHGQPYLVAASPLRQVMSA